VAVRNWAGTGTELAQYVLSDRRQHLVIISRVSGQKAKEFDAERIAAEVHDYAEVVVVENGRQTYEFKDAMPPEWDVYGTAARVYPMGMDNGAAPGQYYVAGSPGDVPRLTDLLLDDVLTRTAPALLASATAGRRSAVGGLSIPAARTPSLPHKAFGTVTGFASSAERAIVGLDGGEHAIIRREDLGLAVRLDWLLQNGQRVSGMLDPREKILDIASSLTVPRMLQAYEWNQVVWCLVLDAKPAEAILSPLPGEQILVRREDVSSNPLDDVDTLLAPGQVVAARLVQIGGIRHLVLKDIDDDEPVASVPVLIEGGSPWLEPGRDLLPDIDGDRIPTKAIGVSSEPDGPNQSVVGRASRAPRGQALQDALLTIDRLKAELQSAGRGQASIQQDLTEAGRLADLLQETEAELTEVLSELTVVQSRNRRLNEQLNRSQASARKAARQDSRKDDRDVCTAFPDEEMAVHHDLYLAWAERIPAQDKKQHPWDRNYRLGEKFARSYFELPEALRRKAAKAVVHLLTGIADRKAARELHPLRSGMGGEDPQLVREDGAKCWRMAVEQGVPAARRLHFWKLQDGGTELHEIVPHDVFTP
jgi:hypothetical protein